MRNGSSLFNVTRDTVNISNILNISGGSAAVNVSGSSASIKLGGINLGIGYLNSNYVYFQSYLGLPLVLNPLGNRVGIGTTTPNARSILDLQSTTQGFLPPRMTTTQRNAIATVAGDAGLTIFNTTTAKLEVWDGTAWQQAW